MLKYNKKEKEKIERLTRPVFLISKTTTIGKNEAFQL